MENRLKERLTGAAILVALIVLVVPELFHGQREQAADRPQGAATEPAERSIVVDVQGPGTAAAPAAGAAPPAASAPPVVAAPAAALPVSPPVPPSGGIAAAPQPLAAATPAAPPAAAPAAAAGGAPTPAPAPAPAARGGHANAGGWSVQLGLFARRDNAERLRAAAEAKGFAASLSAADGNGRYRVRVGGLPDRAAAQTLQQRLRAQGFQAAVVGP